jgi:putative transcriptional regulator
MIRCNLKRLMVDREIATGQKVTYQDIHAATGLSVTTIYKLATNTTRRYDAGTLSALCHFFDVQVGDLLVYVPDGKGGTSGEA